MNIWRSVGVSVGLSLMVACGGEPAANGNPVKENQPAVAKEEVKKSEEAAAADAKEEVVERGVTPAPTDDYKGPVQEITLESDGDFMKWKVDRIEVTAGTRVKIIVKNNATTASMKHNVLIVNKGSVQKVGIGAAQAGPAKQFIPNNANVLFASALTEPGTTTELIFDPPEVGEYQFMCSYIGHFASMAGVFVVKAAE